AQVVNIRQLKLADEWGIGEEALNEPASLDYVTEKGIRFIGKFTNENNTAKAARITFYRKDHVEFFDIESNNDGLFQVNGLLFYDSAKYYYNPLNIKSKKANRLFGDVNIQTEYSAPVNLTVPGYWFRVIDSESPQRFLSNYLLPPDVKLLDEVVIKSTRISPDPLTEKLPGILGGADATLKGSDLKNTGCNVLRAAIGKLPGLQISCQGCDCSVVFTRANGLSITNSTEPLVLVNNVPAGGLSVFNNILPESVERIEFSKRLNPIYGSQAASGIIAVYLKNGV
ncbi:MAG: TonB-dependent receptor plug domain-containing protein, partial [Flammeovirgaceae bacterium]